MDYLERQRFLRYLAFRIAEDEIDWSTHDKRYHGGLYDPKTMTCKARRALEEGDLAYMLTAERKEADYKKLSQYLPKQPVATQDAASPFDVQEFLAYLEGAQLRCRPSTFAFIPTLRGLGFPAHTF